MSMSAPILDIDLSSIQPVAHPAIISNYTIQASYNRTTSSTVLIPGLPAHWTPPGTPRLHNPSTTTTRQQRYPFLPALLSLLAQNSSFTLTSPSAPALITSRKTLLSLYTLLTNQQPQKAVFTCNVVGKTVFLQEKDEVVTEEEAFTQTFVEEYTTWEQAVQGSTGHYRVARYDFGGSSAWSSLRAMGTYQVKYRRVAIQEERREGRPGCRYTYY
ncbi:hypothetical protein BDD12DRAFT_560393 [Trichophaea hybrida]|nr:hypothetical protein BDD12DRAFT_560393 [Trichophaea hybrida]